MAKMILIADDEDFILESIKLSLNDDGYEISEARTGIEALEKARKLKPDLLILDIMMPGMVGYRVCKELKSDPATKDIYVLFLSARGATETELTIKKCGGDAYMPKPFDPGKLRERVKSVIDGK